MTYDTTPHRLPDGFYVLSAGALVQPGDIWKRPTDGVWIETGVAHWGQPSHGEYARQVPKSK